MAWRENTSLYLNTQQIAFVDSTNIDTLVNVDNQKGGWDNKRQIWWHYIDFKTLLGDLYNKYDTFTLSLIFSHFVVPSNNGNTGNWNFYVSGLDFVENGFNQITGNNTDSAIVRFHTNMATAGQIYGGERDCFSVTFRKPNQNVKLTFFHTDQATNAIVPANGRYGIANLQFNIRPCAKPNLFAHNLNALSANLNVSTAKISTSYSTLRVSNEVGSWEPISANGQARQRFSFNINMRNLLGDWWNTYTDFALVLQGFFADPEINFSTNPYMLIYMRGLNFRNTYTQASNVPSGTVPMIFWQINASTGIATIGDKDSRCFPFIKQEANVKLEFDMYDYVTNAPLENSNLGVPVPMPTFAFQFLIMPLK